MAKQGCWHEIIGTSHQLLRIPIYLPSFSLILIAQYDVCSSIKTFNVNQRYQTLFENYIYTGILRWRQTPPEKHLCLSV